MLSLIVVSYVSGTEESFNSNFSIAGCLILYVTDKLSPTLKLQFVMTLGILSEGSTIQSLPFFSLTGTSSIIAPLNKFLAEEPNNANMITIPVIIKTKPNFHIGMF